MFDMRNLVKRYYPMTLDDGRVIEIEPPKLKTLKKIAHLSKMSKGTELTEEDIESLATAISLALSKNRTDVKITPDEVEDMFDTAMMYDFLTDYFKWVNEIQNSKN